MPLRVNRALTRPSEANVVVVDNSASGRQNYLDVLRELGFTKVQGLPSGKDLLHYLEVEESDWILRMPAYLSLPHYQIPDMKSLSRTMDRTRILNCAGTIYQK